MTTGSFSKYFVKPITTKTAIWNQNCYKEKMTVEMKLESCVKRSWLLQVIWYSHLHVIRIGNHVKIRKRVISHFSILEKKKSLAEMLRKRSSERYKTVGKSHLWPLHNKHNLVLSKKPLKIAINRSSENIIPFSPYFHIFSLQWHSWQSRI